MRSDTSPKETGFEYYRSSHINDIFRLEICNKLSFSELSILRTALTAASNAHADIYVFDLSAIDTLPRTGMTDLVECLGSCRRRGNTVLLCKADSALMEMIDCFGVSRWLHLVPVTVVASGSSDIGLARAAVVSRQTSPNEQGEAHGCDRAA